MSVLPIVRWPDARLSAVCTVVDGADVAALVRDMFDTMYGAPGRGLAAPQVGVLQRIFVMDSTWKDGTPTPVTCIDPVIVSASDEMVIIDEGCLSVPDVLVPVERPVAVVLEYRDLDGVLHRDALDGASARIAQHELDHLAGVMHLDRVTPLVRVGALQAYAT